MERLSVGRRVFHSILAFIALSVSALIEIGRFDVPVVTFVLVTATGLMAGGCIVRVRANGCLVPLLIFVGSMIAFWVLLSRSGQWGPLQFAWLPAVLAGGLLGRVLIQKAGRRRKESFDADLRRAGREWLQEIGPLMLFVFTVAMTGVGAINHGDGTESLRYDDELRSTGAVVSGEVIRVDDRYFPGYKGRGHTEYTPVTRQTVDGVDYETSLDEYVVSDEPDYYRVGERLEVMYDPGDPSRAGVRSDDLRAHFLGNITFGRGAFYTGLPLFAVSVPLLIAQMISGAARRVRTRHTRRWAAARREVLSARRRARRFSQGVASAHRPGR